MIKRLAVLTVVMLLTLTGVVSAQEGGDGDKIELTQDFSYFPTPIGFSLPDGWVVREESEDFGIIIFANSQEMSEALDNDTPPSTGIFGAVSVVENNDVADAHDLMDNTLGSLGYSGTAAITDFDFAEQNPAALFADEITTDEITIFAHIATIQTGKGYAVIYLFSFEGEQPALFEAILRSVSLAPVLSQDLEFGDGAVKISLPADWASMDQLDDINVIAFANSAEFLKIAFNITKGPFDTGLAGYVRLVEPEEDQTAEQFLQTELSKAFDLTDPEIMTTTVEDQEVAIFAGKVVNATLTGYVHAKVVLTTDNHFIYYVLLSFDGEQDELFATIGTTIEVDFSRLPK